MVDSLRAGFAYSLGDVRTPMFDGCSGNGLDSTQHLPLDVEERRFRITLGKAEEGARDCFRKVNKAIRSERVRR